MITLSDYSKPYIEAIRLTVRIMGEIIFRIRDMEEDEIILNDFDYNKQIKYFEDLISSATMKIYRYKFDKMSIEEFEQMINQQSGAPLIIAVPYTVNQNDTLEKISLNFNVSIETILDYNDITKKDFWNIRELNQQIKIPQKIQFKERTVFENLSVFDSHSDTRAWGKDISNNLATLNGRLVILNNLTTLLQDLSNIFGEYGSIPFYEELVMDFFMEYKKSELPKPLLPHFLKIKLGARLQSDPRVATIKSLTHTVQTTGFEFKVILLPINVIDNQDNLAHLTV